ncbi:CinA family protein [Enemella sp. A6]|uniref:CinA family protein n=1 Tax=Enemella sp. A6 TaxID=3440152 RepID=UPI003EBFF833
MNRAAELVIRLMAVGQTVATCESLTGGLIGAELTSIPGASRVYRGGLITYATELKHTLAGVESSVLRSEGPVAETTAQQMALGARQRCQAHWGIGVTGVAGPDLQGGQPAGTVWVGIAGPGDVVRAELFDFAGDRNRIREQTVSAAINALLARLG